MDFLKLHKQAFDQLAQLALATELKGTSRTKLLTDGEVTIPDTIFVPKSVMNFPLTSGLRDSLLQVSSSRPNIPIVLTDIGYGTHPALGLPVYLNGKEYTAFEGDAKSYFQSRIIEFDHPMVNKYISMVMRGLNYFLYPGVVEFEDIGIRKYPLEQINTMFDKISEAYDFFADQGYTLYPDNFALVENEVMIYPLDLNINPYGVPPQHEIISTFTEMLLDVDHDVKNPITQSVYKKFENFSNLDRSMEGSPEDVDYVVPNPKISIEQMQELIQSDLWKNFHNIEIIMTLLGFGVNVEKDSNLNELLFSNLHKFGYIRPTIAYYAFGVRMSGDEELAKESALEQITSDPEMMLRYQDYYEEYKEEYLRARNSDNSPDPSENVILDVAQYLPVQKLKIPIRLTKIAELRGQPVKPFVNGKHWDYKHLFTYIKGQGKLKINGVEFDSKELHTIFYETPLAQINEDVEIDWLDSSSLELISAFLQGKIMPYILYTQLSPEVLIRLSSSGSYLDIYENLDARLAIDLCYIWNVPPSEQLKKLVTSGVESSEGKVRSGVVEPLIGSLSA